MNLLRSMLFTPGNNMRMIYKAGTWGADAIILDLEDSVPIADKPTARLFVRDSIPSLAKQDSQVFVRVNALGTGLAEEDLQWAVQARLVGIVVPKAESRLELLEVVRILGVLEEQAGLKSGTLGLLPLLETAKGVANAYDIATTDSRIIALAFGAVDFCRDMCISPTRTGTELLYVRSHIAIAARAAGILSIDSPTIDVMDAEGLVAESQLARQLGFRGKLLIHPNQIDIVNRVFTPSEEEVVYAKKVVEAFESAQGLGFGAISLDGKMIDEANYRQAEELIGLAEIMNKNETAKS